MFKKFAIFLKNDWLDGFSFPELSEDPDIKELSRLQDYIIELDNKIKKTSNEELKVALEDRMYKLIKLKDEMDLEEKTLATWIIYQLKDLSEDIEFQFPFSIETSLKEALKDPWSVSASWIYKLLRIYHIIKNKDTKLLKELWDKDFFEISKYIEDMLSAWISREDISDIRMANLAWSQEDELHDFLKNIDKTYKVVWIDNLERILDFMLDLNYNFSNFFLYINWFKNSWIPQDRIDIFFQKLVWKLEWLNEEQKKALFLNLEGLQDKNTIKIFEILASIQNFEVIFLNLKFLRDNWFTKDQIMKLIKINLTNAPADWYFSYFFDEILRELTEIWFTKADMKWILDILLEKKQYSDLDSIIRYNTLLWLESKDYLHFLKWILKDSDHGKISFVLFSSINMSQEHVLDYLNAYIDIWSIDVYSIKEIVYNNFLNPSQNLDLLNKIARSKNWFKLVSALLDYNKFEHLPSYVYDDLYNIFDSFIWHKNSLSEWFFEFYKFSDAAVLWSWKGYAEYKRFFRKPEYFQDFLEKAVYSYNLDISYDINYIYDNAEENWLNAYSELRKKLPEFSDVALLSCLWNNTINYSITFWEVLSELSRRLKKSKYNNFFDLIDWNTNLNVNTKNFLKWQLFTWLLARWRTDVLADTLSNTTLEDIYNLVSKIINYKNNTLFTRQMYLSLISWIQTLVSIYPEIWKHIYRDYFQKDWNKLFKDSLFISLIVNWKKINSSWMIVDASVDEINKYSEITKDFLIPNNEIFQRKDKQMFYIYSWWWAWWWVERYLSEINQYRWFWYKVIQKWHSFHILEKDWVQVVFVNHDIILESDAKLLFEGKFKPIMIAYRWHNYNTSETIMSTRWFLKSNPSAIVVDGWCRSASMFMDYRESGIDNQIVAYLDTWIWAKTLNFTSNFITNYLRKPKVYSQKSTTLHTFTRQSFKGWSYILENMAFPWNTLDLLEKVDTWKIILP